MIKTCTILAVLCLITGSSVIAQIDPDPNGLGIYLDEDATRICIAGILSPASITGYLIATNPTSDGISGWECRMEYSGNSIYDEGWVLARGSNSAVEPDFLVDFSDDPIEVDGTIIILATRSIVFFSPEFTFAEFWLSPREFGNVALNGLGYYDGEGTPIPCVMPYNWDGRAAAFANPVDSWILYLCQHGGLEVIQNETLTWGRVKALY